MPCSTNTIKKTQSQVASIRVQDCENLDDLEKFAFDSPEKVKLGYFSLFKLKTAVKYLAKLKMSCIQ